MKGRSPQVPRVLARTEAQRLSASVYNTLLHLGGLIRKGSPDAAQEFHGIVAAAVQMLEWLGKTEQELFSAIASQKLFWPLMYSPHPESVKKCDEFLRHIKLGSKRQINICSGKTFSWKVPANVVALNLHQLARNVQRAGVDLLNKPPTSIARCGVGVEGRPGATLHAFGGEYKNQLAKLEAWGRNGAGSSLPELSKETAGQWAKAADELFLITYGPETFENHPYLQELRTSILGRAKDTYGKSGRGVVRKAMRQAVKQAWRSIAGLD